MFRIIAKASAPALGDIRQLGQGDVVILDEDATERPDWGRYLEAMNQAITNGAEVCQAANWPVRWATGVTQ
jgi:hypothetical protein